MDLSKQQVSALNITKAIELLKPVYLDTETTGLGSRDQVIELAIIDHDGKVLINDLMRPTCPITPDAAETHGITPEMLADKMFLKDWWKTVRKVVSGRFIVGYNTTFDIRMLYQTAGAQGVEVPSLGFMGLFDMMQIYSYWADMPGKFGHLKWFRLGDACERMGILPDGDLHRALADTDLTRRLTLALAGLHDKRDAELLEKVLPSET